MEKPPPYNTPRRSHRTATVHPVDVEWKRGDGLKVREPGETEVVSAHGALLRMHAIVPRQSEIILRQLTTHQAILARVVRVDPARADGVPRVAVEFSAPDEEYWGGAERREHTRYQVSPDTFAYFYPADEESTGLVRNLSLGGVYIEDANNKFAEGAQLDLELMIDNQRVAFRVEVNRVYPNKGFAVRFLEYSTDLKDRLERYLRTIGAQA